MYKLFLYFCVLLYMFSSCSIQKKLNKSKWKNQKNEGFIFFYKENSLTEKDSINLKDKLKKSIQKAKLKSNIFDLKKDIHFYIVDSNQEIFDLTKDKATGLSFFKKNIIIQNKDFCDQAHEVFHILTLQNWNDSLNWIVEGSAVYSDGFWYKKEIHKLAEKYLSENKLISFKNLSNKKFKKHNQGLMYIQSGSFCKFLIDSYGLEKFKILWKTKKTEKAYNKKISELESNWKLFLKTTLK